MKALSESATPDARLAAAADIPVLLSALPFVRQECQAIQARVEREAEAALRAGELTPDAAHGLWLEWLTARAIVAGMEKRLRSAQAQAKAAAEALTPRPTGR